LETTIITANVSKYMSVNFEFAKIFEFAAIT